MLLVHGAGGNAAAMWPYAAHLSRLGARVTVVDLPGYGRTIRVRRGRRSVSYGDWQQLLVDLVGREHDAQQLHRRDRVDDGTRQHVSDALASTRVGRASLPPSCEPRG